MLTGRLVPENPLFHARLPTPPEKLEVQARFPKPPEKLLFQARFPIPPSGRVYVFNNFSTCVKQCKGDVRGKNGISVFSQGKGINF